MTRINDTALGRYDLRHRRPSRHRRGPQVGGAMLRECTSLKGRLRSGRGLTGRQRSRRRGWILVPVLALAGLTGVARSSIPEDPNNIQQWVALYNGPGNSAAAVVVAPDGSKVFVTGLSFGSGSSWDYATVAYSAATGAELWVARYNGPANSGDRATSVAVAPDGSKVFVTGASSYGYATVAYRANSCANGKDESGPASGQVHQVDQLAGPAAAPYLHGVNCDVVAANGW